MFGNSCHWSVRQVASSEHWAGDLKALAEKFSVPEENIKIKGIHGKFGSKIFSIAANIYASAEAKDAVEIKKKKEKITPAPEPVPEPVKEEPPQETPVEEPKQALEQSAEAPKEEVKPVSEVKTEVVDDKPQESEIEDNKTPRESEVNKE